MQKVLLAAASACALGVGSAAFAQDYSTGGYSGQSGMYGGVHVGGAFPFDQDLNGEFSEPGDPDYTPFTDEITFDPGFFGSIVLGKNFGDPSLSGFSFELEGFYQALNPEEIDFGGGAFPVDADPNDPSEEFFVGDASLFGGLANVFYTIRTDSPFSPRLGGGVGYGRYAIDIDNAFEDGEGVLVYQGFAGLGYALSESTEIQANARYIGTSNPDFDDNDFNAESGFGEIVGTVGLVYKW